MHSDFLLSHLITQLAHLWPAPSSPFFVANSSTLAQVRQLSPAALAYLGDAVYELYIRTDCLLPPKRLQSYHNQVVSQVRAESQANSLKTLQPYLTEAELEVLRRGRNASPKGPKRRVEPEVYQQATSLETLMGYLYLTDPQRLMELLTHLQPGSSKESENC